MPIRKSTPHVNQNEGLIFERSSRGRVGYDLPALDVPAADLSVALGSNNVRGHIDDFPEVSEMDVVRHFTRLSSWNYSIDAGGSYQTITGGSVSSAGSKTLAVELASQGPSIGLQVLLGASATSPTVSSLTTKVHAIGLADQLVTLPVNCSDNVMDLRGNPIPTQCGPGSRAGLVEDRHSHRLGSDRQ